MGLNRRSVVAAALEMLDEVGVNGLTVRGLAARLGVKSPALYWHFKSKQELFDEMAQVLQERQDPGGPRRGESWRDWLVRRARERRRLLLSHRDGARLVAGTRPGTTLLTRFDEEIGVLVALGFTPVRAMRAITSIGHYVIGFVLEEQADRIRHAESGETSPGDMAEEEREEFLRHTPHLAAAVRDGGDPGGEAAFEEGLATLADGLEARMGPARPAGAGKM